MLINADSANVEYLYNVRGEITIMENQNDVNEDINLTDEKQEKQKSRLPIIALTFGLAPIIFILLWQIPFIGNVFAYLFFATWWGIHFQIAGLILGIIALCNRKKHIGIKGLIISIIAILSPFIWCGVLFYLNNYTGVEIFL